MRISVTLRQIMYLAAWIILFVIFAGLAHGILWLRQAGRKYSMAIDLGQAIIFHDYHKAEILLRAGADPNAADIDDSLLLALSEQDKAMITILQRYGANPSQSLLAAHNVENARALIGMGADPNAHIGYSGTTPFAEHCILGNSEIVQFLLKHRGNPTVHDEDGQTILQRLEYAAGNHPEEAKKYAQVRKLLGQALASRHWSEPH